ncbi:AMP-binding protein [Pseudarthrobacter sp. AL07]|uniref:AMP-binding protein n=1 Tax=unclassified Pseudarthrobacter TaxID=2647000 RepID=UPI00249A7527|nr:MULTISPECIES: AMP-binding protein [unclassified Pseudarthrobacter]MDI3195982.1 AMP-binding protein [Pseudarthrobacter sp. AL20]MDI3210077.1 AMP-binding protein [Pseudarthrobacter sp. AL07]
MSIQLDLQRLHFAANLVDNGDRTAVATSSGVLTYRELAERVGELGRRLGTERRLVALTAGNDVDSLVGYLAAMAAGHPLILLPADKPAALKSLVAAYDPDVILRSASGRMVLEERRPGTGHTLHPDLALLLSTSGSTGSPKLVRLSYENLQANAESIAEYLGITEDDRAMTTLPMSYCYGLSVINSHLLRGASLVLTDLSVVDPCFWDLFRSEGATSFAAVPYTFELLERVGFAAMNLPTLRYVTQAGGRLGPDLVRRYAELGARSSWDLFVMYGQTEATARMAYLPPRLAGASPGAIGIPVPGGAFRIDPVPGLEDGELVYSGPNVMLGYAGTPEDLGLGRTVDELRTGDLARLNADGLYEVVGRRSRFVKIVGLRVDLGQVERILADLGIQSASAGTDLGLVVAVEGEHDPALVGKLLAQGIGLPRAALDVHAVQELPRLASGKPDYPAVLALAQQGGPAVQNPASSAESGACPQDKVVQIFEDTLELTDISDGDTFVSLGGDSLSYVAASVRLEQALGHLPTDWHITPVGVLGARLEQSRTRKRRRVFARLETSIVLRAAAIFLIVSTHIGFLHWQGAAHVLMAVAGFNFARFQLAGERVPRLRKQAASLARVIIPSMAFIGFAYLITDKYSLANIVLLHAIIGPEEVTTRSHFWFIEVLVYLLVSMTALLAVPWVSRAEKRFPFLFPLALFAAGLLTRYELFEPGIPHTTPALWLFALGWAVARARHVLQRCAVSVVATVTIPGFFDNPARELTVIAGVLLLLWLPSIPVPAGLRRFTVLLASASLHIYLVHWLVYPLVVEFSPALAVVASLAAGSAYWALCSQAPAVLGRAGRRILSAR